MDLMVNLHTAKSYRVSDSLKQHYLIKSTRDKVVAFFATPKIKPCLEVF